MTLWPVGHPSSFYPADAYWSRYSRAAQLDAQRRGQPYQGLHSSTPPKRDQPRCLPCTLNATGAQLGCCCVGVGSLASVNPSRYLAKCPAVLTNLNLSLLDFAGINLAATNAVSTCRCTVETMAAAFGAQLTGGSQWKRFPLEPPVSCWATRCAAFRGPCCSAWCRIHVVITL